MVVKYTWFLLALQEIMIALSSNFYDNSSLSVYNRELEL